MLPIHSIFSIFSPSSLYIFSPFHLSIYRIPFKLSWHPSGAYLACPSGKEVRVFSRETWNIAFTLKEEHSSDVSLVAWSPSGQHLVTVFSGQLLIWETQSRQSIDRLKHDRTITSISWEPQGSALAWADAFGHFGVWRDVVKQPSIASSLMEGKKENFADVLFGEEDDAIVMSCSIQKKR